MTAYGPAYPPTAPPAPKTGEAAEAAPPPSGRAGADAPAAPAMPLEAPPSPGAVVLDGVSYSAGGGAIIDAIDLTLEPEKIICLLGPSGCGKSTLLRLLGGLIEPAGGAITMGGVPASEAWPQIAYVFQQPRLCPWRTVHGNVMLGLELRHPELPRPERAEKARGYLAMVGMDHASRRFPRFLSGGEAQRVALARALAVEAPVMLMDEPFASLDPAGRGRLQQMLLDIQRETRRTVVFVTHDIDEAVTVGDEIVLLTPRPARVLTVLPVKSKRGTYAGGGGPDAETLPVSGVGPDAETRPVSGDGPDAETRPVPGAGPGGGSTPGSKLAGDAPSAAEAEELRRRIRRAFGLSGEMTDLSTAGEVLGP